MRRSWLWLGLLVVLLPACGDDREKMARHDSSDHLLAPQQRQMDKAAQVEGLLQETTAERYRDP